MLRPLALTCVTIPLLLAAACGGGSEMGVSGTGGMTGSGGGTSSSGGATGSGGANNGSGGASATGGTGSGGTTPIGSGGTASTGGRGGTGGAGAGTGGSGSGGNAGGAGGAGGGKGGATGSGGGTPSSDHFSFFVTSIEAIRAVSGKQDGFGGDLRNGEATGLAGADSICSRVAEMSMPRNGKTWRAFLSAFGPPAVNAIDRIGAGPWYDRMGRVVAMTKEALQMTRPMGAHASIVDDLPNETGVPNHQGVDNHDTLTGSNSRGMLIASNAGGTCNDWTSSVGTTGKPMCGHSWPAGSGMSWIQAHAAGGCGAGVNLVQTGGPGSMTTVGAGGGYGGFYCFALQP